MTYIRHRDRMIQESVLEDLANTLIALRWKAGTTTRPVVSPYNIAAGWQLVTTTPAEVLMMVRKHPLKLIDYFPEATTDEAGLAGRPEANQTQLNTLAVDDGQAGDPIPLELGSSMAEVPYRFSFAFWASSVGVAQALMNDLRDRYRGLTVGPDAIPLYDYNTDSRVRILAMGVEGFTYMRSAEEEVAPHEGTLFYAQLTITDVVEDTYLRHSAGPGGGDGGEQIYITAGAPTMEADDGDVAIDVLGGGVYEWEES